MQPEIVIGPLTLQTFGICFALGFVAAGAILARRFAELEKPPDWAYEVIFAGLVGGIVGSRLDFLVENWDEVSDDLLGNLFSGSGLVWYGGVVGGALAVVAWSRWRGLGGWAIADIAAPGLAMGYAIGRIGCQLSGDGDYGQPWDGPWAMAYPEGTVATDVPVHPTPIYETLAVSLIAYCLWRVRDRVTAGMVFALYLVLTGAERFLVEFIRRNDDLALGLTQAQLISLGMMLAGGLWIARRARDDELFNAAGSGPSPAPRASG